MPKRDAYIKELEKRVLIFDGAMGGINVSNSLAALLRQKASEVSKRVDNELMPKWKKQRGID